MACNLDGTETNPPRTITWAASLLNPGEELRMLPGDANGDCKVNILDLIFIRNRLNQSPATGDNWREDVNQDGKINILDLIYTRNHLNTSCPE